MNRITPVGTRYLLFILTKKSCENAVLLDQKLANIHASDIFTDNDRWVPPCLNRRVAKIKEMGGYC
jgi:hypothetical protein